MSNKDNPMFMPKRRFPEFKEAGEWESVPLSRLAARTKQKNRDEKIARVLTNSAEFGVIDQRDFFDKDIATQGNLDSYFVVELGSYVYNPRISATAPVGPISKNKIGTGVMSPLYTVFKFKDESNDFYEHYFKTTGWHGYMRQASSTGARHDRMAISSEDFMAMPLPISTAKEQQKIADCLSSLDELIAAQGRKVEALKTHKKGLMQQLFPRAGETQPRLRFPEFHNTGEWKECTVEEIIVTIAPPKKLQTSDYQERGDFPIVDQSQVYICGWTKDSDAVIKKVLPVIVFGDHTCALKFIDQPFAQGADGIKIFSPKRGIDTRFLFCSLEANPVVQESYKRHFSMLKEKLLFYPDPTTGEQQRIASCLSSLDVHIAVATQELDALKTYKKGLTQQLFPSLQVVEA